MKKTCTKGYEIVPYFFILPRCGGFWERRVYQVQFTHSPTHLWGRERSATCRFLSYPVPNSSIVDQLLISARPNNEERKQKEKERKRKRVGKDHQVINQYFPFICDGDCGCGTAGLLIVGEWVWVCRVRRCYEAKRSDKRLFRFWGGRERCERRYRISFCLWPSRTPQRFFS